MLKEAFKKARIGPPNTRKNQNGCAITRHLVGHDNLARASYTRTTTKFLLFSLLGIHYFQPQNPNFNPLDPKFVPKVCLYIYVHKKVTKNISNLKSNTIPTQIINSPIFHKNSQQQLNSHHNSIIMNTHGINHQHLITTTTSIKHEFINDPTTTISYFTNFEQNTKYPYL